MNLEQFWTGFSNTEKRESDSRLVAVKNREGNQSSAQQAGWTVHGATYLLAGGHRLLLWPRVKARRSRGKVLLLRRTAAGKI